MCPETVYNEILRIWFEAFFSEYIFLFSTVSLPTFIFRVDKQTKKPGLSE